MSNRCAAGSAYRRTNSRVAMVSRRRVSATGSRGVRGPMGRCAPISSSLIGSRERYRVRLARYDPAVVHTMFVTFFTELKSAGVPVTLREYLTLMQAMERDLASRRVEDFYYLSRTALVKDERNLDKFDRVFGHVFRGLDLIADAVTAEIPGQWLRKLAEKYLTDEEKKQIEALGGLDKLLELLRRRMQEQKGRHQGGKKWIGTAGTSPFGAYGYNPEGVRIGQDANRNFRAVKVWDRRE